MSEISKNELENILKEILNNNNLPWNKIWGVKKNNIHDLAFLINEKTNFKYGANNIEQALIKYKLK